MCCGVFARRVVNHLIGDLDGKIGAVLLADQVQHQISRRSSPRDRYDLALCDEDVANQLDFGKLLRKQIVIGQLTAVSMPSRNPAFASS